jgi:hypothetical protein
LESSAEIEEENTRNSNVSSNTNATIWCTWKIRITPFSRNRCGYISIRFAVSNDNRCIRKIRITRFSMKNKI